jgi:hypothetical protein
MQRIEIPIGPNCSIDGGPFWGFEADPQDDETDAQAGTVAGYDEGNNRGVFSVEDIQDALSDEMRANEPVYLNTGDVGEEYRIGVLYLPCIEGYAVRPHVLGDKRRGLSSLADDDLARGSYERLLRNHGGNVE